MPKMSERFPLSRIFEGLYLVIAPALLMRSPWFTLRSRNKSSGFSSRRAPTPYSTAEICLHMRAESGQLQIAGPLDDENGEWRGILIYDVKTQAEAKALCDADPAVKAGRLVCDIHGWWAQQGATLK